jgi:CSLREA domain-containing protein
MSGKCPTRLGHLERQDGAMLNNYAFFRRWRRVVPMLATAALLASSVASTPASAQILPLGPRTFTVIENDDVDNGSCTETHCSLRDAINAANFVPFCLLSQQPCRNLINFQFGLAQPLNVVVTSPLPQITGSITIDGNNLPTFQTIRLPNGQTFLLEIDHPGHVQISGNLSAGGDGLALAHSSSAVGTIVNNLQVNGFSGSGIHMKSAGNALNNDNITNNGSGVLMDAGNNLVRGSTITDNRGTGVAAGNSSQGTGIFGNTITGNSGDGVIGSGITVGSAIATDRNVISGNTGCGVRVASVIAPSATVAGNFIGVDATGTSALANIQGGVCAFAGGVTIGGSAPGTGNVISGNGNASDTNLFVGHGITVDSSVGSGSSVIQGNLIGTNAAGTAAIPNAKNGINITGFQTSTSDSLSPNVTILSNVISGNGNNGIRLFGGFKHVVQSNLIGTDSAGTGSIPNQFAGIFIDDARSVTVGMPLSGGDPSQANVISHNFTSGVEVTSATQGSVNSVGNTVRGNNINSNTRLGIDLIPLASQQGFGVVTQPVPVHPDNGPNRLQNLPTLTAAVRTTSNSADVLVVAGNMFTNLVAGNLLVDVYANSSCDLSGFGEGQQFLGSAVASPVATTVGGQLTGFAAFTAVIPTNPRLADGTAITATVTSMARGDTSEFSKCFVVDIGTGAPRLTPNSATVALEQEFTYTYTWTLPAPRPWRQLSDLQLRLRDPGSNDVPLLVRWDETPNTFRLFNADSGKFEPAGLPGDNNTLAYHGVRFDLSHSAVLGSGPSGQTVTLTIPLILNHQFAGHTFAVEVAATDDNGQRADFAPAGTLTVLDN